MNLARYNKAILAFIGALVATGVAVGVISPEEGVTVQEALATVVAALAAIVPVIFGPANKD